MTPNAARVLKIAAAAYLEAIDTENCLAQLRESNNAESRLSGTEAVQAAIIIRKALFQRVLMNIERAYDRSRGVRNIRLAFSLLSNAGVFEEVANRGSRTFATGM